jgi:hypothetical protein
MIAVVIEKIQASLPTTSIVRIPQLLASDFVAISKTFRNLFFAFDSKRHAQSLR